MVFSTAQLLAVPPLENGDRLTRAEFEQRYAAMPEVKKAELIEGVVYMAAALRFRSHGQPHGRLIGWLLVYEAATLGVALGDNPTVRLDFINEPQPDAVLLIERSGQAQISEDDYIEGAPELILEIAASSAAIDLHTKKEAYQRSQVQEYIVWSVLDRQIHWFRLHAGEYMDVPPRSDGVLCSQIFPGLWLDQKALLDGNMQQVLSTLQTGLDSTEHQVFVQRLQSSQP